MKNMKTAPRLMLAFAIVAILGLAIGVTGILGMNSLNKSSSDMYDYNVVAIEAMADLRELFNQERNDIRAIFLSQDDPDKVASLVNGFAAHNALATSSFAKYESAITDQAEEKPYYAAKAAYTGPFADMKKEMFALINAGDFDEAYSVFMSGSAVITPIVTGFADSTAYNNQLAYDQNKSGDTLFSQLSLLQIIVMAIAVIAAVAFGLYIALIMGRPLKFLSDYIGKLANTGNLSLIEVNKEMSNRYSAQRDEIGEAVRAVNRFVELVQRQGAMLQRIADKDLSQQLTLHSPECTIDLIAADMLEQLNDVISSIQSSAKQVSDGSKQISDGSQMLAQGSTEQAASVQELSSSINDVSVKTKDNAALAEKAALLAESIMQDAHQGSEQMADLVRAVQEINDASQAISKVMKVIDDIAFQTNILALNAAVEAARVGQHGKGFAVVAEEVRSLSAKSAEAAKDTGNLINNSMEKAHLGERIAMETAASLTNIVSGINDSTQMVKDIAKSSGEQSAAISQINIGIDQVAQVVQQNSATSQESASASEEMASQAEILAGLSAQFKLRDSMGGGMSQRSLPSSQGAKASRSGQRSSLPPGDSFGKY